MSPKEERLRRYGLTTEKIDQSWNELEGRSRFEKCEAEKRRNR